MARKKVKLKPGQSVPDALVKPLEKAHGGTVKMIGGGRTAKDKMPKRIRDVFPDF